MAVLSVPIPADGQYFGEPPWMASLEYIRWRALRIAINLLSLFDIRCPEKLNSKRCEELRRHFESPRTVSQLIGLAVRDPGAAEFEATNIKAVSTGSVVTSIELERQQCEPRNCAACVSSGCESSVPWKDAPGKEFYALNREIFQNKLYPMENLGDPTPTTQRFIKKGTGRYEIYYKVIPDYQRKGFDKCSVCEKSLAPRSTFTTKYRAQQEEYCMMEGKCKYRLIKNADGSHMSTHARRRIPEWEKRRRTQYLRTLTTWYRLCSLGIFQPSPHVMSLAYINVVERAMRTLPMAATQEIRHPPTLKLVLNLLTPAPLLDKPNRMPKEEVPTPKTDKGETLQDIMRKLEAKLGLCDVGVDWQAFFLRFFDSAEDQHAEGTDLPDMVKEGGGSTLDVGLSNRQDENEKDDFLNDVLFDGINIALYMFGGSKVSPDLYRNDFDVMRSTDRSSSAQVGLGLESALPTHTKFESNQERSTTPHISSRARKFKKLPKHPPMKALGLEELLSHKIISESEYIREVRTRIHERRLGDAIARFHGLSEESTKKGSHEFMHQICRASGEENYDYWTVIVEGKIISVPTIEQEVEDDKVLWKEAFRIFDDLPTRRIENKDSLTKEKKEESPAREKVVSQTLPRVVPLVIGEKFKGKAAMERLVKTVEIKPAIKPVIEPVEIKPAIEKSPKPAILQEEYIEEPLPKPFKLPGNFEKIRSSFPPKPELASKPTGLHDCQLHVPGYMPNFIGLNAIRHAWRVRKIAVPGFMAAYMALQHG
ncbi:hypothetical protein DFH27DRAFT_629841 [Peziza echinospora]|nr:hypothetical protein DFH27DRAFT_629841 [Peziza echinospora]